MKISNIIVKNVSSSYIQRRKCRSLASRINRLKMHFRTNISVQVRKLDYIKFKGLLCPKNVERFGQGIKIIYIQCS